MYVFQKSVHSCKRGYIYQRMCCGCQMFCIPLVWCHIQAGKGCSLILGPFPPPDLPKWLHSKAYWIQKAMEAWWTANKSRVCRQAAVLWHQDSWSVLWPVPTWRSSHGLAANLSQVFIRQPMIHFLEVWQDKDQTDRHVLVKNSRCLWHEAFRFPKVCSFSFWSRLYTSQQGFLWNAFSSESNFNWPCAGQFSDSVSCL